MGHGVFGEEDGGRVNCLGQVVESGRSLSLTRSRRLGWAWLSLAGAASSEKRRKVRWHSQGRRAPGRTASSKVCSSVNSGSVLSQAYPAVSPGFAVSRRRCSAEDLSSNGESRLVNRKTAAITGGGCKNQSGGPCCQVCDRACGLSWMLFRVDQHANHDQIPCGEGAGRVGARSSRDPDRSKGRWNGGCRGGISIASA